MDCEYEHDGETWVCRACGDRRLRPVRRNCGAPAAERDALAIECPYRGEVVSVAVSEICSGTLRRGQLVPVYSCGQFGRCVVRTWTQLRERLAEAGHHECFRCHARPGALYQEDGRLRLQ